MVEFILKQISGELSCFKVTDMKIIITIASFIFILCTQYAQAQVKITIVDNNSKEIVASATAKLQSVEDSTMNSSIISDAAGRISFLNLIKGSYKLTIDFIGYEKHSSLLQIGENGESLFTDSISLVKSSKILDGVTIASKKDFILIKGGKIIMNVAANPIAAGGNAYDVLLRTPGITEQNNSLSFRSKNITILIDGRLINLSGSELATMYNQRLITTLI